MLFSCSRRSTEKFLPHSFTAKHSSWAVSHAPPPTKTFLFQHSSTIYRSSHAG